MNCDDGDGLGDGRDCWDNGLFVPPPVSRSISADVLMLLCGPPPSPLSDVVGDVANNVLRPGIENPILDDEAVDAFESLPGDGAVIESRLIAC